MSEQTKVDVIPVRVMVDASVASSLAWRAATRLGADRRTATEVAIAVRELATNIVKHGGGEGTITLSYFDGGIEVVATDRGRGLSDLEGFLRDGHSRSTMLGPDDVGRRQGLGLGGGAIARLMDSVDVQTAVPQGARIVARKRWGATR